jgi:hypothetical protein
MKKQILSSLFLAVAFSFILQAEYPRLYHLQDPFLQNESILQSVPHSRRDSFLIEHVKQSIANAEKGISKITPQILAIHGLSSAKNRHLLNNLCSLSGTHYLEIGCWKGSTFISALYQNQDHISSAIGIDNWSEFGGPYVEFHSNCQTFLSQIPYQFYSSHSFALNPNEIIHSPINIYFYDGDHDVHAHALAFIHYNSVFDESFIALVDDWNWSAVREGTFYAFNMLDYEILYEIELPAQSNGDLCNWWNGLYIAVIRKK